MLKYFEERFLLSNILEVGKILIMGSGLFESYYLALKGFSTVSINIPQAMEIFIKAKLNRKPINVNLYSADISGFNFPYEFFDYAAFLNNSFELIPYRSKRIGMLKFVNRFLKRDSFLSISIFNANDPLNINEFQKGELIREIDIKNNFENKKDKKNANSYKNVTIEPGDYFYTVKNENKIFNKFRHIYSQKELISDLKESGFEVIEFMDNLDAVERQVSDLRTVESMKGRYLIVSAIKTKPMEITKNV